jgi:DNA-binding HxlR family transcriptional regulator
LDGTVSEPVATADDAGAERAFITFLELLGRRWTLRIVWELRAGPLAFNELRRRAGGMSQSVLVTRLTELFGAGLVADTDGGYRLTSLGTGLLPELDRLRAYSTGWSQAVGT